MVALILTVIVGLWFGSIAEHVKKDAIARIRDTYSRDRETLLVSAEAEKRTIVEESHRRIVEETNRAHAKANFKLGAAVVGLLGVAGVLLYIQLFTLALVTVTTAGGALAGYLTRARQDLLAIRRTTRNVSAIADTQGVIETQGKRPSRALVYRSPSRKELG
jgi:hypothetical protein